MHNWPRDSYDEHRIDPLITRLNEALTKVARSHTANQQIVSERGDEPTTGDPYLDITVETEHRSYTGRVFYLDTGRHPDAGQMLDLYNDTYDFPEASPNGPANIVRVASIVSLTIDTPVDRFATEFPMSKADLHEAIETFLATAMEILDNPTIHDAVRDVVRVDDEQRHAIFEAAQPIAKKFEATAIGSEWNTATGLIRRKERLPDPFHIPERDPRLNVFVVTGAENEAYREFTPLVRFLTHGVPTTFLYPEDRETALSAYTVTARNEARDRK